MTAEEKRKALDMYNEGNSMDEIAKELHFCRATIVRNLPSGVAKKGRKIKDVIYPGIVKWLIKNRVTLAELNRKAFGNDSQHMSVILHGKIDPRKSTIDKILAATGMTYEEAFGTAEDVKGHE